MSHQRLLACVVVCALSLLAPLSRLAAADAVFLRGAARGTAEINISDPIFIIGYLFLGGAGPPCLDAADVNDDGKVDLSDGIYDLNFLFVGGTPPPAPFPGCGVDPTPDDLSCELFAGCLCGGIAGFPCPGEDYFCEHPSGTCDIIDNLGVCVAVPEICPRIFKPVCGCDGVTYSNDCERQRARAQKAHDGACENEKICGGIIGAPCPKGTFCEHASGTCDIVDNQGTCVPIPEVCPENFDPVCGCDGVTYSNDCERQRAQAQKAYDGACENEKICGGIIGAPCPKGTFCEHAPGTCDIADNQGTCVPIPEGCPDNFDPVCGCDGVTYSNDCDRQAAQAQKAHDGPCEEVCDGIIGAPCPRGTFCEHPEGTCNAADLQGTCVPIPEGCPKNLDPVCGCDGVTYSNDCVRQQAQAQKAHHGPCAEVCGGIIGAPCPRGTFCEHPAGTCDVADQQGACVTIPEACLAIFDPVCGCDGVTYSNDCERQRAQAQKAHDGGCLEER